MFGQNAMFLSCVGHYTTPFYECVVFHTAFAVGFCVSYTPATMVTFITEIRNIFLGKCLGPMTPKLTRLRREWHDPSDA